MRKVVLSIFACFFITVLAVAQVDINQLKSHISDPQESNYDKAQYSLDIVSHYVYSNIDSAKYFNDKAKRFIERFAEEVDIEDTLKIRLEANLYTNYGLIAFNKGDFINALSNRNQSTELWEKLNDHLELGICYNDLAVIYKNARDYDKAFTYYEKSIDVLKKAGDQSKVAMVYNNVANLFKEIGNYELALIHANISRDIRKSIDDKVGYASSTNNLGSIYLKMDKLDSAKVFLLEAESILNASGHKLGLAFVRENLSEAYYRLEQLDSAQFYGESSLMLGQNAKNLICIKEASKTLALIYAQKQDWKKAFEMEQLYAKSAEEFSLKELNADLLKGEIRFEYEKKRLEDKQELDKQMMKSQNKTMLLISACVLILAILIFLWLTYKRNLLLSAKNQQIEDQNNERKYLLKEIHHRVKNNFQITTSLLKLQGYKMNDPKVMEAFEATINRVQAMAGVHELIYKNESFDKIDHSVYIENLVNRLEQSSSVSDVDIIMNITKKEGDITLTVPLGIIINELVTNSFKHAFEKDHPHPKIKIDLTHEGSNYQLTYRDNGKGMGDVEHSDSFGIELIHTMVNQLDGEIEYTSEPEWNSVVIIKFQEG